MRSLLRDPGVDRLIRLLLEREYMEAVRERLEDKMQQTGYPEKFGEINLMKRFSADQQKIEKEIKELRTKDVDKISLLRQVAEMLQSLECSEKFDIPVVDMRLPAPPAADEPR